MPFWSAGVLILLRLITRLLTPAPPQALAPAGGSGSGPGSE